MATAELTAYRSRILVFYAVTGLILSVIVLLSSVRDWQDIPISAALIFVAAISSFVWAGKVSASSVALPGERADPVYQIVPIVKELPSGLMEVGVLLIITWGLLKIPAPALIVIPPSLYARWARNCVIERSKDYR